MEQRTEDGRERAALVLAVDVLAFARTATGESELALGWLDQALVHLRVLADQGYDVRSAIASHLELRRSRRLTGANPVTATGVPGGQSPARDRYSSCRHPTQNRSICAPPYQPK